MRKREEINDANKCKMNYGNGRIVEDTFTRPGETLMLEVLLDIRDLLSKESKV